MSHLGFLATFKSMGQNGDDSLEKTNIVTGETIGGKLRTANDTPPSLVILIGPVGFVGKQWLLTQPEYMIGRAVDCSVFLDDRSVSRNHAKITVTDAEVKITDLGSANKTVVNGETLSPMVDRVLGNNDQLKTGNVIFKYLERGNLESLANQQINEKVLRDALTGAYNRLALTEKGPEVMKRAEFLNEELSICVLDIDHFKRINDQHGHPAGDAVLKQLSQIIGKKLVRSNDFFARFGGEEFVIMLIGSPLKNAVEVAERVRATIADAEFEVDGKKIPVTISIGVANRKTTETEWETLFKRADQALYQSKQGGRNRVTVAP